MLPRARYAAPHHAAQAPGSRVQPQQTRPAATDRRRAADSRARPAERARGRRRDDTLTGNTMAPTDTDIIFRNPTPEDEPLWPSLLDLLLVVARRKWLILGMSALGAIAATAAALLLPPQFTGTAVIMPPAQQQSTASALLGQLGPIAGLAGRDLGIKNPSDLYIGILTGRTIADDLIVRFDLRRLYRVDTMMDARKRLASLSSIAAGKDSLIKISVDDLDRKRAAALANAYVDELYKQTNRLALTESAQRRLFFERQLAAERNALATAEAALKATQERTGVLHVSAQVEAVI